MSNVVARPAYVRRDISHLPPSPRATIVPTPQTQFTPLPRDKFLREQLDAVSRWIFAVVAEWNKRIPQRSAFDTPRHRHNDPTCKSRCSLNPQNFVAKSAKIEPVLCFRTSEKRFANYVVRWSAISFIAVNLQRSKYDTGAMTVMMIVCLQHQSMLG